MYKWLDAREDMQDSPPFGSMIEEKGNESNVSHLYVDGYGANREGKKI